MTALTALTTGRQPPAASPVAPLGADPAERIPGTPGDPAGPAGLATIPRPREAGAALVPREARFGARFVPAALGGSLTGVDSLARVIRQVFRRDVDAGMALGATPFSGTIPVWTGGSPQQQARLAELLLGGGGISLSHDARSIRDAFAPRGLRVRRRPGGLVLDGEATGFQDTSSPHALLLHVVVESGNGTAGEPSLVLIDLARLPRDRVTELPGRRLAFTDCPLSEADIVGDPGDGPQLFLKALQISGSATSSMSLGAADTCLRIAMERMRQGRRAASRSLSARTAVEILNGAFLTMLTCDCLALAGTRAVGIAPGETSILSAAVRSVVPMLLCDSIHDLAALLGPQSLRLDGRDPLFARHTRQLNGLATSTFIARAAVLPQLPFLARHVWFDGRRSPDALFDPAGEPAAFEPHRLTLLSRSDGLSGVLGQDGFDDRGGTEPDALLRLVSLLRAELEGIQSHFAAVEHAGHALVTDPRSLAMTDRYMLVLTAAACLGCYEQLRARGDGFLSEPAWITGALTRIVRRLGIAVPALPGADVRRIQQEASRRLVLRHGFDLYDSPLDG